MDKKLSQVNNQRSAVHYLVLDHEAKGTKTKVFKASGFSLFCLSETNPLRKFFIDLTKNKYFENTILTLIAISTINLALESPLDKPNNTKL